MSFFIFYGIITLLAFGFLWADHHAKAYTTNLADLAGMFLLACIPLFNLILAFGAIVALLSSIEWRNR